MLNLWNYQQLSVKFGVGEAGLVYTKNWYNKPILASTGPEQYENQTKL